MTDTPEPAGPRNLHDSVVQRWGAEIVDGTLPTGSRVVADEAAERFGVSRSVIREAVRVLESMGLLATRRRVGITVQPPEGWNPFDPNIIRWRLAGPDRDAHLRSLGELRGAVEPLAARLAAERADPEDCGRLTAAVIGMSATARAADGAAYLGHDADFHRALLRASGNPMLAGLSQVVVEVLAGRTRHALMPRTAVPEAVQWHAAVAAAVQAGDPDAAEEMMRRIIGEAGDALARQQAADRRG
ncbi:FCD domain-containing protein [Nakamurella sp. YIM 132087]|uniref:FCD domain-containing protein n=1 Tax=Nakamurella alba TaxID=2665158 RepID=A0A7K1FQS0_9ACTN|nr:FCD domain-containing protein [Nakamurella alba]MTD16495.1 FCD domain-containing protein [Nakamurella alba]